MKNQDKDVKTGPILLAAYKLLETYTASTGSLVYVHDESFLPIPEMMNDSMMDRHVCFLCPGPTSAPAPGAGSASASAAGPGPGYGPGGKARKPGDFTHTPCNEMHIAAMKKAFEHRGSFTYACGLGFNFWTSPIYSNRRFIGALLGIGYRAGEKVDELFRQYGAGQISPETFREKTSGFSGADGKRIGALAELLHICAESLSTGNENCHGILRRRAEQQRDLSVRIEKLKARNPHTPPVYPIRKERELLAAVRRGETAAVKELLGEILAAILCANPNDLKYLRCRVIELAVLLSWAGIKPGYTDRSLLETDSSCIKRIRESESAEELIDVLYLAAERATAQVSFFRGVRHGSAIRKAECYIKENFTRKLSLQEIAKASDFSAPYFSTIFKEEMGESLSNYLNSLRVEKAARMLLETGMSLSEIAGSCGFEDQSWFSKTFKTHMGISPGKYRDQGKPAKEISEDNFSEEASRRLNR